MLILTSFWSGNYIFVLVTLFLVYFKSFQRSVFGPQFFLMYINDIFNRGRKFLLFSKTYSLNESIFTNVGPEKDLYVHISNDINWGNNNVLSKSGDVKQFIGWATRNVPSKKADVIIYLYKYTYIWIMFIVY